MIYKKKMKRQILAILSLLCLPLVAAPKMPVRGLCAHRGDSAAFPENTVPAIEASAKKGAAMVEIDVKRCKTGERAAPAYRDFRAHGGMVNYCFANTEEDAKKIYALGLDFALTDNLDAMLPFFPTRFADEK